VGVEIGTITAQSEQEKKFGVQPRRANVGSSQAFDGGAQDLA
jgi:hypothetical protein